MAEALSIKSTAPTPSLRDRIHALPQELFDEIYDLTFTVPTGKYIRITRSTFPPVLQVNQEHRKALGKVYYLHNMFVARTDDDAAAWYTALGHAQRFMMPSKHLIGGMRWHRGSGRNIVVVDNVASVDGRAILGWQ